MRHTSEPELLVLHSLRLKGFAEPDHVAAATALSGDVVVELITALRDEDLVGRRDGRISGFLLTDAGKRRHTDLLEADRNAADCQDRVQSTYDAFVAHNETFKQLCCDWQLRTVGGASVPNDHSDAAYDAVISARLGSFQRDVAPLIDDIAMAMARFLPYGARLHDAVTRFGSGETSALSRPLSGSYHDVWMELHEDLLLTLGRARDDADGY